MNEVSNFCTGQVCSITASNSLTGSPGDSLTDLQQVSCWVSTAALQAVPDAACLPWQQA